MWTTRRLALFALPAFAGLAIAVSGCGGTASAGATATTSSSGMTVAVKHVGGAGNVLVDSKGDALYSPEQESNGMVLCKGSCTSIWVPLTLSAGAKPTAAGQLNTTLGTVQRPGGGMQVTYHGKPLYTFVQDTSPGMVTGNGVQDQFGGQQFTWHVAAVGAVSSGGTGGTSTSNGYGY